ncbi:LPS export ABC transporter periplasmic protein LptC [Parvibium lacunae]|uniref:LPS export ABC transporter periplasmic protein LptC n=1 Tax=Parvibium lacunae TaxID=1888893 RepID=UPI001313D992|nr:LPS export ABC transporter periplasmic protein LptC [Parvibium lacunae]
MVLLLLAGLALATGWFAQRLQQSNDAPRRPTPRDKPDFIIEQVVLTRFDRDGLASYRLQAQELRHFPGDGSAWLRQPIVATEENPAMRRGARAIRAEEAWLTTEADTQKQQIDLSRGVVLTQAAFAETPALTVESDLLTLLPDDDLIKTDALVTIQRGASVLQGEGLILDNTARTLTLERRVQATLFPLARTSSRTR